MLTMHTAGPDGPGLTFLPGALSVDLILGGESPRGAHTVSPGKQLPHRRKVEVGSADFRDQVGDAVPKVLVAESGAAGLTEQDGALDGRWVAPDLGAPIVEHAVQAAGFFRQSEAIPDVRVLCHQPEGDFLAATPDQEWEMTADGTGVEPAQPVFNNR